MRSQRSALMIAFALSLRQLAEDGGLIQAAEGPLDGENQEFSTGAPYVPGSLVVLVNGTMPVQGSDEGWDELGGRWFRLRRAPRPDDTVLACYLPRA